MENDKLYQLKKEKQLSKPTSMYQFFKLLAIGFSIVSLFIFIAVLGFIWVSTKNQQTNQTQKPTVTPTISPSLTSTQ